MARSVTITTPIPTLEELRASLGVSKRRVRSLIRIMDTAERRLAGHRGKSASGPRAGKSERAGAGR